MFISIHSRPRPLHAYSKCGKSDGSNSDFRGQPVFGLGI